MTQSSSKTVFVTTIVSELYCYPIFTIRSCLLTYIHSPSSAEIEMSASAGRRTKSTPSDMAMPATRIDADKRFTLTAIDAGLKSQNKVHEMAEAERLFAEQQYDECAQRCYAILQAMPSEAIVAKCHMMLASEAIGPEYATGRACVVLLRPRSFGDH